MPQKRTGTGPGRAQAAAGATIFSGEWLGKGSTEQVREKHNPDNMIFWFCFLKNRPCRGGYPAGSVGGGNEGKEETSFRIHYHNYAIGMPALWGC
jgi:hypothetical protein